MLQFPQTGRFDVVDDFCAYRQADPQGVSAYGYDVTVAGVAMGCATFAVGVAVAAGTDPVTLM